MKINYPEDGSAMYIYELRNLWFIMKTRQHFSGDKRMMEYG